MYTERASSIGGAVVWRRTAAAVGARVLPDGCMDLIWADGALLIAGPDTRAHLVTHVVGTRYVGLRFAPGVGPAVFGVPAHELRDQRVALDALWPGRLVRDLAGRVTDSATPGRTLEHIASTRLHDKTADIDWPRVAEVLRRNSSVDTTAGMLGLSRRQLHRRCLAAFGYGPKTLAKILRFNDALELARTGGALADVAIDSGYADQAHLARDTKVLAGVPMTRLLG
ncbi:MAG TPA: AraC family transcriptional regulator [Pseudonocardiaceae bacterium]|nr:AraC family transcriptional regulator [Pseudonocardiaceae bacterium]